MYFKFLKMASPWRRKCNPLQYSCLENSMDRGAWWAKGSQKLRHNWATQQEDDIILHLEWTLNPTTGVLVGEGREGFNTERHIGENSVKIRGRDWNGVFINQKMLETSRQWPKARRQAGTGFSLRAMLLTPWFRLLVCRTVTDYGSFVLSHPACGNLLLAKKGNGGVGGAQKQETI